MAYPKYIHDETGETRGILMHTRFSARMKNAMVSCSMLRGLNLLEAFEEACVCWLKLNGHKVPEFDKKEMYLASIKILKQKAKERKAKARVSNG
jgi:hypothetical protein